MLFMNDYDISMAVQMHRTGTVARQATEVLSRFVQLIDENSDGWCHWPKGPRAAKKLMELIQSQDARGRGYGDIPPLATEDDLKKALRPIKSFCTRHNFQFTV